MWVIYESSSALLFAGISTNIECEQPELHCEQLQEILCLVPPMVIVLTTVWIAHVTTVLSQMFKSLTHTI